MYKNKQNGFSLLELMVAMVISVILVSMAYPAYASYQAQGYRQRAEVMLLRLTVLLASYYAENNTYIGFNIYKVVGGIGDQYFPYRIVLKNIAEEHFLLQAVPNAKQLVRDFGCATLSITDTNLRQVSGSKNVMQCWPG